MRENDSDFRCALKGGENHGGVSPILLIGHSMGVFLVGYATAWDAEILGVGMIAASNLGPSTMRAWARDPQEIRRDFSANASRLLERPRKSCWKK